MSDDNLHAGWHTTDDIVPVRSGTTQPSQSARNIAIGGPAHDIRQPTTDSPVLASRRSLRLSALTGIAIVTLGTAATFGIINLRGDIAGTGEKATVTITKEGHFSPSQVTLARGERLVITNENENPQVLKPKDGRELFPVQVLFEAPYETNLAMSAEGTYTYISETLPENELLTITIKETAVSTPMISTAEKLTPQATVDEIPLPFGGSESHASSAPALRVEPVREPAPLPAAAATQDIPVTITTEHDKESAVVSIASPDNDQPTIPTFDSSKIPTNPYTVADGKKYAEKTNFTATKFDEKTLHSGAPLMKHTPVRVTETGPIGSWMLFIPALLGLAYVYKRSLKRCI